MIRPSSEIRSATVDEMPRAIAALVAAFLTDPFGRFMWPSPHDYLSAAPVVAREFAGGSFDHGTGLSRGRAGWERDTGTTRRVPPAGRRCRHCRAARRAARGNGDSSAARDDMQRHRQHVAGFEPPDRRDVRVVVQHALEPLAA